MVFALDCCARETLDYVAPTQSIKTQGVQDFTILAVEHRFGSINILPYKIEWLLFHCQRYKLATSGYRDGGLNNAC